MISKNPTEDVLMNAKPTAAENSEKRGRVENLKPFKPGQSGNPGGRPKKRPITELYERILADPTNIAAIEKAILATLHKGNMAMVLLVREIAERIEGKVMQPIEADLAVNLADAIAAARKRAGKGAGAQ
jgi:hypothetical protein